VLTALGWLAVAVLIAANALFVAAEFGLTSVDRAKLARLADAGDRRAKAVQCAIRELSFQLSGAQLGITVCSLLLGFVAEPVIAAALEAAFRALGLSHGAVDPVALVLALALATVAQMLFGELVPQNFALARPLSTARAIVPFQLGFTRLCRPVIRLFNNAANAVVRAVGVEPQEELRSARTPPELAYLATSSAEQGALPTRTAQLLRRALAFGDKTAADVMTPRVQVEALPRTDSAADLLAAARASGRSRFPVYGDSIDEIDGVVHVKHAYTVDPAERAHVPVAELMVDVVRVPTSLPCDPLLKTLRRGSLQLEIVVDEYGGTAGVVTLEDLVEELLGQIRDEHDTGEAAEAVALTDGSWSLAGGVHRDDAADLLGVHTPDGPYDTVAGLVLHQLGRIPEVGDRVEVAGWTLRVARVDGRRIDRIVASPPPSASSEDGVS
jgi:CBS domain containing-hemolysin-like protein